MVGGKCVRTLDEANTNTAEDPHRFSLLLLCNAAQTGTNQRVTLGVAPKTRSST
jgi:hypothetical protein